jgi:DUF1680 family protein
MEGRLDNLVQARFSPGDAWQKLYPETEEAFRLREDDRSHPGRGVWRGEFWGKYVMSAIAVCRYTSSDELKSLIAEAVRGLLSTQENNGYIGTYSDSTYFGPGTWNIWCRKYTLWGLLEAYELLGDPSILEAASRFADHLINEVGPGCHPIIETGQFCGIPSTSILKPVLMLYRATGKRKYLEFAEYIADQWTKHPEGIPDLCRKGVQGDPIHKWFPEPEEWAKSYEFISCVEGMVELYRVTGNNAYFQAAKTIHERIVEWERSPVGSVSFNDKFIASRYVINTVAEICDAIYWNRLSFELFLLTKDTRYIDEIERTLYNALLCGLKPDGSWGIRRLRLTHEHIQAHEHFLKRHQCCVDNMPRGLYQAAESAWFTDNGGIYLALYLPGEGTVRLASGQLIGIDISGDFLDEGQVTITLSPDQLSEFTVNLRIPSWSGHTRISINGTEEQAGESGSWLRLERCWAPGDTVTLRFDIGIRVEFFDPGHFAENDPIVGWHIEQWAAMGFKSEDEVEMNAPQKNNLKISDALPHRKAAMLFRGPLALARDIRLDNQRTFSPLPAGFSANHVGTITPISPPDGIWKAYELELVNGERLRVCDFASAGNTWDTDSQFAGWQMIE